METEKRLWGGGGGETSEGGERGGRVRSEGRVGRRQGRDRERVV